MKGSQVMLIGRFLHLFPANELKQAITYFNKGEYRRACGAFEKFVSRHDISSMQDHEMIRMYMVESYVEFAKGLVECGKHAEAAEKLERAIRYEPKYADVHFSLGKIYDRIGKTENAKDSLDKALAINPHYFRARIMVAKVFHNSGDYKRAIEELENGLSDAPTFYIEQVKELRNLISGGHSFEDRERLFHVLLEEKPSSAQVSKQIGLEAIQNGDYDFALVELKKAISLNPNYPDLHNLLGIAYGNKGMTDDALLEFQTALKIHPDYLKARLNIALTLYEKNSREQAMKHLELVLKLDPENELAQNLLAELEPAAQKG